MVGDKPVSLIPGLGEPTASVMLTPTLSKSPVLGQLIIDSAKIPRAESRMNDVTPYPALNTLLTEWAEGLKRLLGKNIVGLYLSGSLAFGDFVPDRSDIDLQAIVRSPLTKDELRSVEQLHKAMESRRPEWAGRIECSYVPLELMHELTPPRTPRPWWGFGTFYAEAPAGNEWIINHYLLSKHGMALAGPEFKELIPAIDIHRVREASARDLFQEWVAKGRLNGVRSCRDGDGDIRRQNVWALITGPGTRGLRANAGLGTVCTGAFCYLCKEVAREM
jgi:hypothetical protein